MPHTDLRTLPRATRRTASAAAALLLTMAAACSSDIGVSTTEPVTGPGTVYALASANDINLPATFTSDGMNVEIRKGALTLGADSSFIFSIAIRTSTNGSTPSSGTTTLRGPFHRSGTTIVLVQQADTLFQGTYSPNAINLLVAKAQVTGQRFNFAR